MTEEDRCECGSPMGSVRLTPLQPRDVSPVPLSPGIRGRPAHPACIRITPRGVPKITSQSTPPGSLTGRIGAMPIMRARDTSAEATRVSGAQNVHVEESP